MTIALLVSGLVAVANLFGGWIVTAGAYRSPRALNVLVAFGAGFMLAVALLEMLPRAMDVGGGLTAVLLGYLAVHFTQHTMTPHFHFGEETHHEAMVSRGVGIWALVGLIPHSFFDGVAIASAFLVDAELGFLVSAAVLLHKVPTGVSLASVMLASGNTRKKTIWAVIVVGLAVVIGAAVTPGIVILARYGLALAAGVTIYVAASNLIPESQHQPGWMIPGAVFLGVAAFYLVQLMIPHV